MFKKIIAANANGHAGKWHHTNAWDKPAADISNAGRQH